MREHSEVQITHDTKSTFTHITYIHISFSCYRYFEVLWFHPSSTDCASIRYWMQNEANSKLVRFLLLYGTMSTYVPFSLLQKTKEHTELIIQAAILAHACIHSLVLMYIVYHNNQFMLLHMYSQEQWYKLCAYTYVGDATSFMRVNF